MNGRDKCELLNEIRLKIALKNNIEFNIEECTYEGDCTGTCPKCESELEYLEMELKKKQANGEKIELEGIFTLNETEPTEVGEPVAIFDTFGSSIPESFFDYLIAKHFYDYEDGKPSYDLETSSDEDDEDSEEKIIVYELQDGEDDIIIN